MLRSADGNKTAGAYKIAVLNRKRPSVLALSRQKLPQLSGTSIEGVEKGGYIVSDNSNGNKPDLIFADEYKESVLPEAVTGRISIEAESTLGWQKYVGSKGKAIGIDKFGASAPAGKIYQEYGITVESVIAAAKSL
ncbi:hypothetical protein E2562_026606 [Oryza meyeriana var. granulata]|uniref:Transketolase-like C-terminal domain-containing protein n=1 Tax=Oryza meyeriana var. granulata TaxID=110450 RepID=A0A6G1CT71_9ORYZ|nr:hypothetical protein E2562_026606 [Oryza meyeriana var. granulata]